MTKKEQGRNYTVGGYIVKLVFLYLLQGMRMLHEYFQTNSKYLALKLLDDDSFTSKDSPSWKMFSSVLYDLTKLVAGHCRDMDKAQIKEFVDVVFTQWWNNTPNLMRMDAAGQTMRFGNANLRLKTYARSRIRSRLSALLGLLYPR